MVGGLHLAQRRVVSRQAGDFRLEIDVVATLVQVRIAGHRRPNFSRCPGSHTGSQKPLKAEHATLLQRSLCSRHHVVPVLAALAVQGVTVQVDDVSQKRLLRMKRPILLRLKEGLAAPPSEAFLIHAFGQGLGTFFPFAVTVDQVGRHIAR